MPRESELDRQWMELMALCTREKEYRSSNRHPKLLRFISAQIDQLADVMGFSQQQIKTREFRAEKMGERVVRILIE